MNLAKLIGRHADQRLLDALDRRQARRFDAQPATPTGFGDLWPANPATAQAIEQRDHDEWADGAQQRRIDARNERDGE